MDDATLRQLLAWPDDPAGPPSSVDVRQALRAGRRKLRRRLSGGAAGSALAVCAVVAVVSGVGPPGHVGPAPGRHGAQPGGAELSEAPRQFDPLIPYASFGWLPAGTSLHQLSLSRTEVLADAGSGGRRITLLVESPGICQLAGPLRYRARTRAGGQFLIRVAPRSLRCGVVPNAPAARIALAGPMPSIHGGQAWRSLGQVDAGGRIHPQPSIAWRYAPGGWAVLTADPAPGDILAPLGHASVTLLKRLAGHVRFGGWKRLRTTFTLKDLPGGWTVQRASLAVRGTAPGGSVDLSISAGPAARDGGVEVDGLSPPTGGCSNLGRHHKLVSLGGGVTGLLTEHPFEMNASQVLCVPKAHGLNLLIRVAPAGLDAAQRSIARADGLLNAVGAYHHLRFSR